MAENRARLVADMPADELQAMQIMLSGCAHIAIEVDNEGKETARGTGPVWCDLPQTAQAAEYTAWSSAVNLLDGPSTLYGDCLNVVHDANATHEEAFKRTKMPLKT